MPLSWLLEPWPFAAGSRQRWEVSTSRKERSIEPGECGPLPRPNHLHSQRLYQRSRPTSSRGEEALPGMSDSVSKAPLPQNPWTPVLLGPFADVPLRRCLRVTGYLFTELSSGSSYCRNQEGRRRRSLPSSRISPPTPPPLPPPAKLWAAAQLCPPALGRTKDGVVPNDLEMRGTVPTGHSSTCFSGLDNCWLQAIGGEGFIQTNMALTPMNTQTISLFTLPLNYT